MLDIVQYKCKSVTFYNYQTERRRIYEYDTDYSFLFSNVNDSKNYNNNMFYGINFSDYATIRNGSYGKLLNAYYSKVDSQTSSSDNHVTDDKNASVDSSKKQEITDLQKSVDELQASASKLLKKGSLFKTDYKESYFCRSLIRCNYIA